MKKLKGIGMVILIIFIAFAIFFVLIDRINNYEKDSNMGKCTTDKDCKRGFYCAQVGPGIPIQGTGSSWSECIKNSTDPILRP